jgi:DNA-binding GntR family transcriptional regulator
VNEPLRVQATHAAMRRAIEELRSRGLVVTLPAKGTFVVAVPGDGA